MVDALSFIRNELSESRQVLDDAMSSPVFADQIHQIARSIETSLRNGGKAMFAGNGGSAADAQHIAGEFVSRLNFDRGPVAGLALTTDTSVLTAIGNDYGYEQVFARQVVGLGRAGDIFVGISTSGRSPNIVLAAKRAREEGILTIGFVGADAGPLAEWCDLLLNVPSSRTPMIQQIHIVAAHIICGLVEKAIFPNGR